MYWRGSALAFPSGEGGTANAVTEEVYRQYVFAKTQVITQLFTAPLPGPVAVPEKIIVLTLILDFFDRCHYDSLRAALRAVARLHAAAAAVAQVASPATGGAPIAPPLPAALTMALEYLNLHPEHDKNVPIFAMLGFCF